MNTLNTSTQLRFYRQTIDNLDASLIYILAERFRCTEKVGHLKAHHKLQPRDNERERQQTKRLRLIAAEAGLDPDFAQSLFRFIVQAVVANHEEIALHNNSSPADD